MFRLTCTWISYDMLDRGGSVITYLQAATNHQR